MNDIEITANFICGSIVPKEIYEKAKKKCEEANTNLYEFIKTAIYELVNGNINIKKVVEDE